MVDNSNDYNKIEDILENPGLFCFRLENENNSFVLGKKSRSYGEKEVKEIKMNITEVFRYISDKIDKYKEQNPEYLGHIINNLDFAYKNKKKFYFPGLQVINMDREKLNYFAHWPDRFLLCEKSDGVRYLLIQYKNGICHLVGRSLEFFEIICSEKLPPSYIRNSYNEWNIDYLLDGELVIDDVDEENDDKTKFIKLNKKNKKINFLIFDAVVIKGENFGFMPFKKRLEQFSKVFMEEYDVLKYIKSRGNCFINKYINDIKNSGFLSTPKLKKDIKSTIQGTKTTSNSNNKSITLYMKDYYYFDQVQKINNLIKLLPHHNDGLIINVDDYPYYSGQSCEIFKWKPLEMNTIDFEIVFNNKIKRYILYITTKENNCPVEILCFNSDEEKNNFETEFRKNNKNIGECFYDSKILNDEVAINNYNINKIKTEDNDDISAIFESFINKIPKDKDKYKGGWRFQRFRNDKLSSNFINTYQNIKISIKEDIHMNEIIETVDKNKKIKLSDLDNEKNFMSALIWKKFFKKNNKKDEDEDNLFLDDQYGNGENNNKNELLNKKRKNPDEKEKQKENDNDNEKNEENNDNQGFEEDEDDYDLDKIYDDVDNDY